MNNLEILQMTIENEEELQQEFNAQMKKALGRFRSSKLSPDQIWQAFVVGEVKDRMPDIEKKELWSQFRSLRKENKEGWVEKLQRKRDRWKNLDQDSNLEV